MNRAQSMREFPRQLLIAAIAVFGAGYTAALVWQATPSQGMARGGASAQVMTMSAADVPPGMEQTLAKVIGEVVPNLDELYVFPSSDGKGFTVSMTVDYVGDSPPTKQQIQQDVNELFPAAYNSHEPVEDVEAYFSFNGEIMAGAEMGARAYQTLDTSTGGSQSSLAARLAASSSDTSGDAGTAWMQVDNTISSDGTGT